VRRGHRLETDVLALEGDWINLHPVLDNTNLLLELLAQVDDRTNQQKYPKQECD
jgi:hypothetical protein